MAIAEQPQTGLMGESMIDRPDLEKLLEDRQASADRRKTINADYRKADRGARGIIEAIGLEPGEFRCGRFVITVEEKPARQVEFEVVAKRSVRITPAK